MGFNSGFKGLTYWRYKEHFSATEFTRHEILDTVHRQRTFLQRRYPVFMRPESVVFSSSSESNIDDQYFGSIQRLYLKPQHD